MRSRASPENMRQIGDRSARRIAADDAILSDALRPDRAAAVLSARRSRGGRCDQGPRRKICVRSESDPRAALPPMTPYYLMRCGLTALLPYYRPGDPAVADAIKGLAGKYASDRRATRAPHCRR